MAVMLVASIVCLIDSIPLSIRTIYAYSARLTGVTPRGDPTQTPVLIQEIKKLSPVPLERTIVCRASGAEVQSIVGKWPFTVLGLSQEDMGYYLRRMESKGIQGRLPTPGEPEAVISRPVATNLRLVIYDPKAPKALRKRGLLLSPDRSEAWSPKPVKIVGIVDTDKWLMLNTIEYQRENHFPPVDVGLVFTHSEKDQRVFDKWALKHFKGRRALIVAYSETKKNADEMFNTLYVILDVVIGTLVLVITFMMGMLMNIYQSQRLVEFGLLQALGYTKRQLVKRVILEGVSLVILGWLLGCVAAYGLLNLANLVLMSPKAFAIDTLDPVAYRYTVPLPIAILVVAVGTVVLRFRKFDPVGVVERRLV